MRPFAPRDGDAEAKALTRRRDHPSLAADESGSQRAISCCAVAKCASPAATPLKTIIKAIVWTRITVRTPGKKDKPL
jgi:hypothetical protein